jgi:hypothetical protein
MLFELVLACNAHDSVPRGVLDAEIAVKAALRTKQQHWGSNDMINRTLTGAVAVRLGGSGVSAPKHNQPERIWPAGLTEHLGRWSQHENAFCFQRWLQAVLALLCARQTPAGTRFPRHPGTISVMQRRRAHDGRNRYQGGTHEQARAPWQY